MIEIKIPKEIRQYEARFVGPFTMRQTVCLGIALPCCIGLYILLKPLIGVDLAGFMVFLPAGIGFLFGWYKPYGMPFEKYLQTAFVNSFLAPSKRLYKTENYYEGVLKEIHKADASESASGKADASAKKSKYKRSKLAIK